MRKIRFITAPALILALSLTAWAQEKPLTTSKGNPDTIKATVSGNVNLDYVWRSGEITAFTNSVTPSTTTNPRSENTFEGFIAVRMDVELSDKVSAVVEFGTKRVDGGAINEWGNATAETITLREANLTLGEFLMPELKAQFGLSTWNFDVRGKGSSFAFDPRHSQSIERNVENTRDVTGTLATRAGSPEEMEPIGAWVRWSRDKITVDGVALPAVIEGGSPQQDEALYAVDLWYSLEQLAGAGKGSQAGAIVAVSSFTGTNTSMWTLGGGATLRDIGAKGLELYGEAYFQFGDVGTAGTTDVKAKGKAFQVGAQFNLPDSPYNIWVAGNFTWITGDDDAVATNKNADTFASYENVHDLLILEDMYYGFDWDTNYTAFKFSGGAALSVGNGKNNLEVSAIVGLAKTTEDVSFATGGEDGLGNEIDGKLRWIVTKQASINAGVGFLFSSDVMEESMGGTTNRNAEDNAWMYVLGADLKF